MIGFYNKDEEEDGPNCSTNLLKNVLRKNVLSRFIRRAVNDNKKLDCHNFNDLLNLFSLLDEAEVCFPTYASVDLTNIPNISPGQRTLLPTDLQ